MLKTPRQKQEQTRAVEMSVPPPDIPSTHLDFHRCHLEKLSSGTVKSSKQPLTNEQLFIAQVKNFSMLRLHPHPPPPFSRTQLGQKSTRHEQFVPHHPHPPHTVPTPNSKKSNPQFNTTKPTHHRKKLDKPKPCTVDPHAQHKSLQSSLFPL